METPLFAQLQQANLLARTPVRDVLRRHWREILLAAGCRLSENSCFYLFTAYVIAYATKQLQMAEGIALRAVSLAAVAEFIAIPVYGLMSDYWSRKGMYILGCLVLMCFAVPYYALLATREPHWFVLAVILSLAGGHAMLYSVQASLIPELFGTRLRYSGASIGYQLAAPIAGGLAPLIAASLTKAFPNEFWPLAQYIIVISAVSLGCVMALGETSKKDLGALE
jgi:MFS family permease